MKPDKKTIIIFGHPNLAKSRINKVVLEQIKQDYKGASEADLKIHDVGALYGNKKFNEAFGLEKDRAMIENYERVIFQFPVFWYGVPPVLKQYIDELLAYDWAYGARQALKDKEFAVIATYGGPIDAYTHNGHNKRTAEETLQSLWQLANFAGMKWIAPFGIHGAARGVSDEAIKEGAKEASKYLQSPANYKGNRSQGI